MPKAGSPVFNLILVEQGKQIIRLPVASDVVDESGLLVCHSLKIGSHRKHRRNVVALSCHNSGDDALNSLWCINISRRHSNIYNICVVEPRLHE